MSFTTFKDVNSTGTGYKCSTCGFEKILHDGAYSVSDLDHDCSKVIDQYTWDLSVEKASGINALPESIKVNGETYKRYVKKEYKKLQAEWYEKGRKVGRESLQDELRELLGLTNLDDDMSGSGD